MDDINKMAKQEVTYDSIIKEINSRQFAPVYYLMGEEPYYIDRLADYIAENVLSEEERGFNQMVIYGQDTDIGSIVAAAKRYPMMAEYQVIIVKEAQTLRNMDELVYYLQKPQPTTVLVFCHKYGTLDRRKKVAVEIEKTGRLFESKKLKDSMLPSFISSYVRAKGTAIDAKAAGMMVESIGADLSRLASELDKLIIAKPKSDEPITPELVEDCVGISKEDLCHAHGAVDAIQLLFQLDDGLLRSRQVRQWHRCLPRPAQPVAGQGVPDCHALLQCLEGDVHHQRHS